MRHLPLVDLLVDTRTELFELAMRAGLRVFTTMLEEDRTAICGPRYAHQPDRAGGRAGTVPSEVVLGGRKVAIQRPRVRTAAGEVPLPTFATMAHTDPLDRRVVEQMLGGVATRQYARSLEPLGPEVRSRGTSKSAVSRRFVARTRTQLETWQAAPLDPLDRVGLLLDGVHVGEHCLIVALGIAADGTKHALGLGEGSTENATVCQGLLSKPPESRAADRPQPAGDPSMARRRCGRPCGTRSARWLSFSAARFTSSETSSTTCRIANGRG
jgi:transposase-like protein